MDIEKDRQKEIGFATKVLQLVKEDYQSIRPMGDTVLAEEIKKMIDKEIYNEVKKDDN